MTLGQEFTAFGETLLEEIRALEAAHRVLCEINMGATAIGTGNAPPGYSKCRSTRKSSAAPSTRPDPMGARHQCSFSTAVRKRASRSSCPRSVTTCGCFPGLLVAARDQPAEAAGFLDHAGQGQSGHRRSEHGLLPRHRQRPDHHDGCEAGQLQLNVFEPVIAACIFEAQTMFINAARTLRPECIDGITANLEVLSHYVDFSIGTVTALNPLIGYERDGAGGRSAENGYGILELVREKRILSEAQIAGCSTR
jgi:aspartate ammonia-lyase